MVNAIPAKPATLLPALLMSKYLNVSVQALSAPNTTESNQTESIKYIHTKEPNRNLFS